jgi:hypothetical protein
MQKMEIEEIRSIEDFHQPTHPEPARPEIPIGLGSLGSDWKHWRASIVGFLRTGCTEPGLTIGERRRLVKLALEFALTNEGSLVHRDRFGDYLPVPTSSEISDILEAFHDDPCGGHYAAEMTFQKVSVWYYWQTMRMDIYDYTRTCDKCQRAKDFAPIHTEPLRPIVCLEPFEILTVDYSGPHNPSRGCHYCLFLIDNFTGWLEVLPTRKADGITTGKVLRSYCFRYGFPKVIHSDRGPHFSNEVVMDWAENHGVKWVFGAPGVAKSQGKAQRSIKSVKEQFARSSMRREIGYQCCLRLNSLIILEFRMAHMV